MLHMKQMRLLLLQRIRCRVAGLHHHENRLAASMNQPNRPAAVTMTQTSNVWPALPRELACSRCGAV